jgi:hypothetical protein
MKDINKLIESMLKEYYLDLYLINYDYFYGMPSMHKELYIQNTIEFYQSKHPEFDINRIKKSIEIFDDIVKKDLVIKINGTLIYKELYKILWFLDSTFKIQKILNDAKAYPDKFAYIQSDQRKTNEFRRRHKKNIIGKSKLGYRGESRLRYQLVTLFEKNKNITQFFIHNFLLADIVKVAQLHEEDEETVLRIFDVLNYFLTQKTNIDAVIKSLAILLYFEMQTYLKINQDDAEVYTKEIIDALFNSKVNMYEFNQRITLDSSIVSFPIFGSSKQRANFKKRKKDLSEAEENLIKKFILKEFKRTNISMESNLFETSFQQYLKTPHIQFLKKYPVELFRINPKYSS